MHDDARQPDANASGEEARCECEWRRSTPVVPIRYAGPEIQRPMGLDAHGQALAEIKSSMENNGYAWTLKVPTLLKHNNTK
jgi:hypothetical protein